MIGFEFNIASPKLESLVFQALSKAISEKKFDINAFEISLNIIDQPEVDIFGKCLSFKAPFEVAFSKQAGLFTVQGHGKINIALECKFDVSPNFILTTKTGIVSHSWEEKPVIDFGSLDITSEKLVDLILNHYNDVIASGIDSAIKSAFDLQGIVNKMVEQLSSNLTSFSYHGLSIFIQPSELMVEPILKENNMFHIKGALRADIACGNINPFTSNGFYLRWVETLLNDNITYVHLDIPENSISMFLCEFINRQQYGGENLLAENCTVDFSTNKMEINLNLSQPISGLVIVNGKPRYNEFESKLYIDQLDVNLKASNFIYKLSAPLVNKFLESSIKDNLPISVNSEIMALINQYKPLKHKVGNISIEFLFDGLSVMELVFSDDGVKSVIKVSEFAINGIVTD